MFEKLDFREFILNTPTSKKMEDWEVVNLYHQHYEKSVKEMARISGHSIGEFYRALQRGGGYKNRQPESQRDWVRSYHENGFTPKQMSNSGMIKYSERHLRRIIRGK
jgi:hypothetical protein